MRIFILGFMGTGKTHWGKLWAEANNMEFFDMDALIEKEEQASVVDIFEREGEDYFRVKEASQLRDLSKHDNCIISCGGGAPCFYENMQWMNDNGTTVYLSAPPAYILQNVLSEKEKRPIIKNINEAELLFFIEQKLKERLPFYNQAMLTLDAETLDVNSLSPVISSAVK
ncbi:MAG: shikimate kinase [Ferruginibacter sp.]